MSERVPEGWEFQTLGEVSSIVMGQSPDSKTYNDEGIGLPFFQGKANFGVRTPKVKYWCSVPSKVAPKNSILFSVRAPVGNINFSTEECCIGRGLASITAISVEQEFLYQSLLYSKPKFEALGQGSTFEAINGAELKGFIIDIPPIPEQKKIASILTSVDGVIENTQKQIDKLQDLKKATINEFLTRGIGHTEFKDSKLGRIPKSWKVTFLGNLGEFSKGKGISKNDTSTRGIPCIRYAEIYTDYDYVIKRFRSFISRDKVSTTKRLKKNDIVFAGSGETVADIGKSVSFIYECEAYVGGDAIVFSPIDDVDSTFLSSQLNDGIRRIQLRKLGQGSSIIHIYSSSLKHLRICLPPLDEQQKIVSIITSLEEVIEDKRNKLHQTQFLKKSLMQDLLTGKVRVQVN